MDPQAALQCFDPWLLFQGFRSVAYPPLKTIYFRDDRRNPDVLRGANFIIFEALDGISTPGQLQLRCDALFPTLITFFKKKMGGIRLADNFIAFMVFPVSEAHADLVDFVTSTRPGATSLIGTHVPVVMDLSHNKLHYFTPDYSRATPGPHKLADQIDLLFLDPLRPAMNIPENLTQLVNLLRGSTDKEGKLSLAGVKDLKIEEIRLGARRMFYEGVMHADEDSARKLLYSWYLKEFLRLVEMQRSSAQSHHSDSLSLTSFLSLEQFATDVVDSLGKTMLVGFQTGFDQSQREIANNDLKKRLSKNRAIACFAYCRSCKKAVQLTENGQCPKGIFHGVNTPTYFEINEQGAIQNFCTKWSA